MYCMQVRYENIYKIDISDIDAITETLTSLFKMVTVFNITGVIMAIQLFIKIYDDNDSSNQRKVFKKDGDADPELIYEGDRCCYAHIMLDDKIYAISDNSMEEIVDGEYINYISFDYGPTLSIRLNSRKTIVYNNEMYSLNSDTNTPVKLISEFF